MREIIFILIGFIYCNMAMSQPTGGVGQSQGNYLTVNKCQIETNGATTDFYTLYYCQTGKQPKKIGDYLTSSGASFTPSGTARFIAQGCIDQEKICIEEYIIDGNQIGNSTPSVNANSNPFIGRQVIITSNFRSISWNFAYGTMPDPGDGSVASVDVNGFTYYPTNEGFNPDGYVFAGNKDQYISSDFSIVANGDAIVKVTVIRTNCE